MFLPQQLHMNLVVLIACQDSQNETPSTINLNPDLHVLVGSFAACVTAPQFLSWGCSSSEIGIYVLATMERKPRICVWWNGRGGVVGTWCKKPDRNMISNMSRCKTWYCWTLNPRIAGFIVIMLAFFHDECHCHQLKQVGHIHLQGLGEGTSMYQNVLGVGRWWGCGKGGM